MNLALVLDNSGSMKGKKIDFAKEAAIFTVKTLLPTDRVSVTTFNSHVKTIVPSGFVTDTKSIVREIERVGTEFMTALHPGWVEGGRQVLSHLIGDGINRIVLLSDGKTNKGLTDSAAIADDVRGLARRGVSTTTMGVGEKFNEDLLESMARAGGGNYYYIESPDQLPKFFQAELEDMMTTVGCRVSLGFEPANGVTVSRVLNDFETNSAGQHMMPNVVAGRPVGAMVRLNVPAQPGPGPVELCHVCLEWARPGTPRGRSCGTWSARCSPTLGAASRPGARRGNRSAYRWPSRRLPFRSGTP